MLADRLTPAGPDEMQAELTACLALCGAAGMTEDARCEWLKAARLTLEGLPADLLAIGCHHAREVADHPSKIVPAILAETSETLRRRRELRPTTTYLIPGPPPKRDLLAHRGKPMSEEDTAELNRQLESLGAKARYRTDGTRYFLGGTA